MTKEKLTKGKGTDDRRRQRSGRQKGALKHVSGSQSGHCNTTIVYQALQSL